MATDLVFMENTENEPALFAGIEGREISVGIMLTAAQGILRRGSVVIADAEGDAWTLLAAAPTAANRIAILGETTDTGATGSTEDQLSHAYMSGLFNREAIVFGGVELTAEIEEVLRGKGIYLDCVVPGTGAIPAHQ